MKLTYKNKVQIYEPIKQGYAKQLSKKFWINISNLCHMVKLTDCYGIKIVKKEKKHRYSPYLIIRYSKNLENNNADLTIG